MGHQVQGRLGWIDLTVEAAEQVRDFYSAVVGWTPDPVDMGGYEDFNMLDSAGDAVAGVCHRRGVNASIPRGWLPYFVVGDLDEAVGAVRGRGGAVPDGPRVAGDTRWAIATDPAGNAFALWEGQG